MTEQKYMLQAIQIYFFFGHWIGLCRTAREILSFFLLSYKLTYSSRVTAIFTSVSVNGITFFHLTIYLAEHLSVQ